MIRSSHPPVPTLSRAATVAVLTLALVAVWFGDAAADPSSAEVQRRIDAAQTELEQLMGQVETRVEDYNEAVEAREQAEATLAQVSEDLAAARRELAELTAQVNQHVRRMYMLGPAMEFTSVFIAGDPNEVGTKATTMRRIFETQWLDLEQVDAVRVRTTALEGRSEQAAAAAAAAQEAAEEARAVAEAEVERHEGRMRELERELQAAQDREERERQRQRELELQRQAQARVGGPTTAQVTGPAPPPRAGSGRAVDAALSRLGSPYRWGATGPGQFDCSGLIVWAYRQAGVSLPRTSRAQFAALTPITRSELRPGDLVFAGSPVHHVGMYIGNGQIVHSPHSGAVVSIRSMERRDLAGFRRVTG